MTATARPSLARATGVMAVGTLLSRVTGFGRAIALAYAVGQDRLTDAYNVANTTPNIIYELVLGGVLSATLVPIFVRLLRTADGHDEDGDDLAATPAAAWRDISAIVTLAMAVAVGAAVAFVLAAPAVAGLYLSSGATADQRSVATSLVRMFAPQIPAYCAIALTTALLSARRRFAAPMFAPIANNVVVIAILLALPHVARSLDVSAVRGDRRALLLLGLGTTAGVVAMAAAQLAVLPRAGLRGLRPVWAPGSPAVRRLLGLSGWTLGVVGANQVALWVVYRLATGDGGTQSAYTTAQIFFLLPHGVYAVSVMTALQPDMAERWAAHDLAGMAERVRTGIRTTMAVIVPAAVGLAIVAGPLVTVLLQHGRFDGRDADRTATALAWFAIGLPGFSGFLLLTRAWQAMQDTRSMFLLYALENLANIVLALVLFGRFGVGGLAAAYAGAYTIAAVASLLILGRRLPAGWLAGTSSYVARLLAATAVLGAAAGAVVLLLAAALPAGTTRGVAQLGGGVAAGAVAFLVAAIALRLDEAVALARPILRRAGLGRLVPTS